MPAFVAGYLLFQPDHVAEFMETTAGWTMIGVCAALEIIGVIWVYNILKVKY